MAVKAVEIQGNEGNSTLEMLELAQVKLGLSSRFD
jgi:hypothetical protein